jgi:hypothetical protein
MAACVTKIHYIKHDSHSPLGMERKFHMDGLIRNGRSTIEKKKTDDRPLASFYHILFCSLLLLLKLVSIFLKGSDYHANAFPQKNGFCSEMVFTTEYNTIFGTCSGRGLEMITPDFNVHIYSSAEQSCMDRE